MTSAPAKVSGVAISNPDKVWWPDEGITKLDIVRYYDAVWPLLRPWLRDRPLSAERCPDGMRGSCFYQKNFPAGSQPAGAPRLRQRASSTGKDVDYLVGGERKTLLSLANLGCIAMHVMNARRASIGRPDWLAFDLDPSSGTFADAAKAGLALRRLLEELRVRSFPKTSGSRGLHVFVPLRAGPGQAEVTAAAAAIGAELARREPKLVTVAHSKAARGGRVYADSFRNAAWQTIAPRTRSAGVRAPRSPSRWTGMRSGRRSTPHAGMCAPRPSASAPRIHGPGSGTRVNVCRRWLMPDEDRPALDRSEREASGEVGRHPLEGRATLEGNSVTP